MTDRDDIAPAEQRLTREGGEKGKRDQAYNSSPSQQMLLRVALHEELAHSDDRFARPETLRLKQAARATRIKIELDEAKERAVVSSMLAAVRAKRTPVAGGSGDRPGDVPVTPGPEDADVPDVP